MCDFTLGSSWTVTIRYNPSRILRNQFDFVLNDRPSNSMTATMVTLMLATMVTLMLATQVKPVHDKCNRWWRTIWNRESFKTGSKCFYQEGWRCLIIVRLFSLQQFALRCCKLWSSMTYLRLKQYRQRRICRYWKTIWTINSTVNNCDWIDIRVVVFWYGHHRDSTYHFDKALFSALYYNYQIHAGARHTSRGWWW